MLNPAEMASHQFAQMLPVYLESGPEIQAVIQDMVALVNDPQSNREEVEHALNALADALFPGPPNLRW